MKKKIGLLLAISLLCLLVFSLAACSDRVYTVTTNQNFEDAGTITAYDEKEFAEGEEITVTAEPNNITYRWLGWYRGDHLVSESLSFSFAMKKEDVVLTAKWEKIEEFDLFECKFEGEDCEIINLKDKNATQIIIPEGVTKIGDEAFETCTNLKQIALSNTVKEIGDRAFAGCTNLSRIEIREGVAKIGYETFAGCMSLKQIELPNTVKDIGIKAFSGCSSLVSMTIPNSVTLIGEKAFVGCKNMIELTTPMPNAKESLFILFGDSSSNLKKLTITGGMILDDAFKEQYYLNELVIGDGVGRISSKAFYGCANLKKVTIGTGVYVIEKNAFAQCDKIESVIFLNPDGWTIDETPISKQVLSDPTSAAEALKSNSERQWGHK